MSCPDVADLKPLPARTRERESREREPVLR